MSIPSFYQRIKPYLFFSIGLMWGLVIAFILMFSWAQNSAILEYESRYNFEETCARLDSAIQLVPGWEMKVVPCALPQTLDNDRIKMFKLCNASYAGAMINDAPTRAISSVLPCQFSIYERDGKTYIARLNIGLIGILLGDPAQTIILQQVLPDQKEILTPLVK